MADIRRLTQIKISIIFDELFVKIKAVGKISGLENKRDLFIHLS